LSIPETVGDNVDKYLHSVTLVPDKCHGCTHCLDYCPTEAIRIREGKAVINPDRCIDCGECIRVCKNKAKKAVYDKLEIITNYKFKIALPAPTLYGQFDNLDDLDYVIEGLYSMGFDYVYEVSRAAELISEYTRRYLKRTDIPRPVINSACPVILRLISLRFPSLANHVMPLMSPMEFTQDEKQNVFTPSFVTMTLECFSYLRVRQRSVMLRTIPITDARLSMRLSQ